MTSAKVLLSFGVLLAAYASATATESPRYGYTGSNGPSNWGSLSPDYKQCSAGNLQSPINIVPDDASKPSGLKSLERSYSSTVNNYVLINTGSHIELKLQPSDGHVSFNGTYNVDYIRFHTPSEHTIDNEMFPLELQIVHRDQDGQELVVSILYKLGSPDTFLYLNTREISDPAELGIGATEQLKEPLEKLASEKCGDDQESQILMKENLKTKTLSKAGGRYFGYVGSQTVPPCKEGVLWFISRKVRTVSEDQIKVLQAPLGADYRSNSRPIFPRGSGSVTKYDD